MMIFLTSFQKSLSVPQGTELWSAAVYQPKGFSFPKAEWSDIRTESGNWTRPREFVDQPQPHLAYREALLGIYQDRQLQASAWLAGLAGDAALCCWCPYDQAAQRQLKEWGSFICHTAVLGEFLQSMGEIVWYDSDRLNLTVLKQGYKNG